VEPTIPAVAVAVRVRVTAAAAAVTVVTGAAVVMWRGLRLMGVLRRDHRLVGLLHVKMKISSSSSSRRMPMTRSITAALDQTQQQQLAAH